MKADTEKRAKIVLITVLAILFLSAFAEIVDTTKMPKGLSMTDVLLLIIMKLS